LPFFFVQQHFFTVLFVKEHVIGAADWTASPLPQISPSANAVTVIVLFTCRLLLIAPCGKSDP